ncbi:MAG: 16S rRNA (cytosine(967)-C(5))-methyltransferase RsmB [bacterium]|jgi:16S rRNA (cytosine967-C5)-methyltransferase|nr:16S rRNA (cytosine(967)-C(5))-methyltransferase RsmB [Betaproteobacteria bacterium]
MEAVQVRAARTVAAVIAGRSLSTELVAALDQPPALAGGDRGQLQDLCYGTLRHLGELRAVAAALVDRPLTDAQLQALLWVALYQLRHTRAAPYAVVDGAVEACPAIGSARARGLMNAVLRNALRRRAEMDAAATRDDSARYSFPAWWIDRVRKDHPAHWREVLAAGSTHPPFTLRINLRRVTVDAFIEACAARDIEAVRVDAIEAFRMPSAPHTGAAHATPDPQPVRVPLDACVRLPRALPVDALPGFAEGWFSVQDAGAQLAAPLLDARGGQRVLDACAAPGGKSTHLLERAAIDLVAIDSDAGRLRRVADNLGRLGQQAALVAADAAHLPAWWDGRQFDRILLDAPCSGSGVVRRHPDIKWLRRAADLPRLAAQQRRLLQALWPVLAPGGLLLYCTCSVFPVENESVPDAFLADQPDARRVSCAQHAAASGARNADGLHANDLHAQDSAGALAGRGEEASGDDLRLLPDPDHDGFHYALLSKP